MANLAQIEKHLKKKNLPYKVIYLGREVFTVEGVVDSGVNKDEVVKTLIARIANFTNLRRSSQNIQFAALAIRGKDRLDFKKVRKLFGPSTSLRVNCELAKPAEVLKVAKVPVGAVCPILLNIPVYFDRNVMNLAQVHMGSGDLTKGLEMKLEDLLKAVGKPQVEDLV